jgi:hypothetical protein
VPTEYYRSFCVVNPNSYRGEAERSTRGEMRGRLEMMIEENVRSGLSLEEARYAALRSFGRASGVHARG